MKTDIQLRIGWDTWARRSGRMIMREGGPQTSRHRTTDLLLHAWQMPPAAPRMFYLLIPKQSTFLAATWPSCDLHSKRSMALMRSSERLAMTSTCVGVCRNVVGNSASAPPHRCGTTAGIRCVTFGANRSETVRQKPFCKRNGRKHQTPPDI